jgi:hypothetical protein
VGFRKIQAQLHLLLDFHWRCALHRHADLTDIEDLAEIEHLVLRGAAETRIGGHVHFLANAPTAIEGSWARNLNGGRHEKNRA